MDVAVCVSVVHVLHLEGVVKLVLRHRPNDTMHDGADTRQSVFSLYALAAQLNCHSYHALG